MPRSPGPASLSAAGTSETAGCPPSAVRQSAESGAVKPASGTSLARIEPSGRRISARMIPRGVMNVRRPAARAAARSGLIDVAVRSAGVRRSSTKPRTTCVSVPTAWLSADVETWTDASMTCAVAVTPTITRKTP